MPRYYIDPDDRDQKAQWWHEYRSNVGISGNSDFDVRLRNAITNNNTKTSIAAFEEWKTLVQQEPSTRTAAENIKIAAYVAVRQAYIEQMIAWVTKEFVQKSPIVNQKVQRANVRMSILESPNPTVITNFGWDNLVSQIILDLERDKAFCQGIINTAAKNEANDLRTRQDMQDLIPSSDTSSGVASVVIHSAYELHQYPGSWRKKENRSIADTATEYLVMYAGDGTNKNGVMKRDIEQARELKKLIPFEHALPGKDYVSQKPIQRTSNIRNISKQESVAVARKKEEESKQTVLPRAPAQLPGAVSTSSSLPGKNDNVAAIKANVEVQKEPDTAEKIMPSPPPNTPADTELGIVATAENSGDIGFGAMEFGKVTALSNTMNRNKSILSPVIPGKKFHIEETLALGRKIFDAKYPRVKQLLAFSASLNGGGLTESYSLQDDKGLTVAGSERLVEFLIEQNRMEQSGMNQTSFSSGGTSQNAIFQGANNDQQTLELKIVALEKSLLSLKETLTKESSQQSQVATQSTKNADTLVLTKLLLAQIKDAKNELYQLQKSAAFTATTAANVISQVSISGTAADNAAAIEPTTSTLSAQLNELALEISKEKSAKEYPTSTFSHSSSSTSANALAKTTSDATNKITLSPEQLAVISKIAKEHAISPEELQRRLLALLQNSNSQPQQSEELSSTLNGLALKIVDEQMQMSAPADVTSTSNANVNAKITVGLDVSQNLHDPIVPSAVSIKSNPIEYDIFDTRNISAKAPQKVINILPLAHAEDKTETKTEEYIKRQSDRQAKSQKDGGQKTPANTPAENVISQVSISGTAADNAAAIEPTTSTLSEQLNELALEISKEKSEKEYSTSHSLSSTSANALAKTTSDATNKITLSPEQLAVDGLALKIVNEQMQMSAPADVMSTSNAKITVDLGVPQNSNKNLSALPVSFVTSSNSKNASTMADDIKPAAAAISNVEIKDPFSSSNTTSNANTLAATNTLYFSRSNKGNISAGTSISENINLKTTFIKRLDSLITKPVLPESEQVDLKTLKLQKRFENLIKAAKEFLNNDDDEIDFESTKQMILGNLEFGENNAGPLGLSQEQLISIRDMKTELNPLKMKIT